MSKIRLGIMGFGRIGRQIYQQALKNQAFDVVAISDIGQPEILHNLLLRTDRASNVTLEGNHLVSKQFRTRLMATDHPNEIPWDVFGVDMVIEATGQFKTREDLVSHVTNGAPRVILSTLPLDDIDRVILRGVNDNEAKATDQIISAGSASTTGTALALKTLADNYDIENGTMTSVHAYTSDQSLQDYAGLDYRRSRSGAENIIPNETPALRWVQHVLPQFKDKLSAYALNVPVQVGSMIDLTLSFMDNKVTAADVNQIFIEAAAKQPDLIATINDPIVSSDVRGSAQSLLVDLQATLKAGNKMVKLLAWHETLGHAQRILDVAAIYAKFGKTQQQEAS